jgi:CheY-like chemotaxis protein
MARHKRVMRLETIEFPPASVTPPRQVGPQLQRRKSVLVVDDEPGVVAILIEVLGGDGHAVEVAANGQEAMSKLEEIAFDVIVCDILMPIMDGLAFYSMLEARQPHLLTRVIFLTGDILNPRTQTFLQQVSSPVLEKPFALKNVREAVGRILQAGERS